MKKVTVTRGDFDRAIAQESWDPNLCLIAQTGIRLGIDRLQDFLSPDSDLRQLQKTFDFNFNSAECLAFDSDSANQLAILRGALPMAVAVEKDK